MTNDNITKERLQLALQRKDMLPAELARECDMNKGSISRYLAGTVIPKQSAVEKMAKALGVSPIWLLGFGSEEPNIINDPPKGTPSTEDQLKHLMILKSGSVNKFANECGVSNSTIATIFTRGVCNANVKSIGKICKALGLSVNALVDGRIAYDPMETINTKLLSEENFNRLLGYYYALLDTQGGRKHE